MTDATAENAAPLSEEQIKSRAAYSHNLMRAFGSIITVFARSAAHRTRPLAELEALVVPAITSGQFSLAEATHRQNGLVTPIAAVLWANVSAEVDQRLSAEPERFHLERQEWRSGDIVWIVEAVGDKEAVARTLQRQKAGMWKDRPVKIRVRDASGRVSIRVLQVGPESV